jgi:two-component system NarL family response regulator
MIDVMLIEPLQIFRLGLRQLLESQRRYRVVWEGGDEVEALAACVKLKPQVVIMRLNFAKNYGTESIEKIRSLNPRLKIIVISSASSADCIYRSLRAGARSFLPKNVAPDIFLEAVEAIAHTAHPYLTPEFKTLLQQHQPAKSLSKREAEILRQVTNGLSNKEIGLALGISASTVKNHLNNILAKLEAKDRTHAVMLYWHDGHF